MTIPPQDDFNWARSAGLAYLAVAVLAGFAEFSVRTGMVVQGDTAATMANIAANQMLYGLAGIADLLVLLLDTWLGLADWMLLKPLSTPISLQALFLNLLRLPCHARAARRHWALGDLPRSHRPVGRRPARTAGQAHRARR